MSALTASLIGWVAFAPVLAPVPPEPPPDPFAKGYLGIWFNAGGAVPDLTIDRVEPNQPAARAGLRGGDVIVRVNALQPHDSQQVIAHVCAFRPGALIEIEVRRGSERKVFKVKLAGRPPNTGLPQYEPWPPVPIE